MRAGKYAAGLVLILATMACALGGQQSGVLFEDDFSKTSSGWDRVAETDYVTDYQDDEYHIKVNVDASDAWANPGKTFSDVIVEVDARLAGGTDNNDFGVICRYQRDNFYFMLISSDGYYVIGKVLDGEFIYLSDESFVFSDAINLGAASNRVRGDCVGSTLTLYVNGTMLAEITDTSFSTGDVGLMAGTFDVAGTDIAFDNFVARTP